MNRNPLLVHLLYIVGILLTIIIYLITIKFGQNDELVKYLSFGLTITSLFVGLIAIFQSFFSSDSISRSMGLIDKSSSAVSKNAAELNTLLNSFRTEFESSNTESQKSADLLKDLIEKLKNNIDKNTDSISELGKKIEAQKSAIPQGGDKELNLTQVNLPEEFYERFFDSCSISSQLLFFAIQLSFKSKKKFKIAELGMFESTNNEYYSGYFIASSAAEIFQFSYNGDYFDTSTICEITELNPFFEKYSNLQMEAIIKEKKEESWYKMFATSKKNIEKFFSKTS